MSAGMDGQLRLTLEQVIHMMKSQAPEGVVIQGAKEWPGIAWMILQAEAEGMTRLGVAAEIGIEKEAIDEMVLDLIQAPEADVSEQVWGIGLLTIKASRLQVKQVLGTTWDQVEAMAIEKLAEAIHGVSGKNADPMKLASLAKIANSATRRSQGEGQVRGIGVSNAQRMAGGIGVDIEMQSGDLGSIRLRFSPKVLEQMNNPTRVIDVTANRPDREATTEMLRLKEIRPIAEAMDTEESKAKDEAFKAEQAAAKDAQLARQGPNLQQRARAAAEQFRLHEIMGTGRK